MALPLHRPAHAPVYQPMRRIARLRHGLMAVRQPALQCEVVLQSVQAKTRPLRHHLWYIFPQFVFHDSFISQSLFAQRSCLTTRDCTLARGCSRAAVCSLSFSSWPVSTAGWCCPHNYHQEHILMRGPIRRSHMMSCLRMWQMRLLG